MEADRKIYYGKIFMYPGSLKICQDSGIYCYDVENITGLQVCFESCINSDECKNWGRYGHPEIGKFRELMPVKLFMGKKEGDTVELLIKGKKIIVTIDQLNSKYFRYGAFHDFLYDMTKSFGGIYSSHYFTPPLCEKRQCEMLINNHKLYSESIGYEIVQPNDFRYNNEYLKYQKRC